MDCYLCRFIAILYIRGVFGTPFWTDLLPTEHLLSKMPCTRLNSNQSIAGQLVGNEDICLITKDALEVIIRENADTQRKLLEVHHSMAQSLELIAVNVAAMSTSVVSSSESLNQKLDSLTETIKRSNATLSISSTSNFEDILKQRKQFTEKIARHELLSRYYDELLNESTPFVRKEFRTKINKNASDVDLRYRRQQTIDNVKVEIAIMQGRLIEFAEKKRKIEERIENNLKLNEDMRDEIAERTSKEDRTAKEEYERDKLSLMKKTDDEEKRTIHEFLLSFQGEDREIADSPTPKNFRGQNYKNRRKQRGK